MAENRYKIIKLIGKGRIGSVYEAEDTVLKRKVAFRRFSDISSESNSEDFKSVFEEFSQTLSSLQHPGVASIFEAGVDTDGPYIVSLLLKGTPMGKSLESGVIPAWEVVQSLEDVLDALVYIHQRELVHGAFNTSSVMRVPKVSGGFRNIIVDMGLAQLIPLIHGENVSRTMLGEFTMMAPELFDGAEPTAQSDLYMVGQFAYISLVGGHPFSGMSFEEAREAHKSGKQSPVTEFNKDIPKELSDWIQLLLKVNPDERPSSVADALKILPRLTAPITSIPTFTAPVVLVPAAKNTTGQVLIAPAVSQQLTAPLTTALTSHTTGILASTSGSLLNNTHLPPSMQVKSGVNNTAIIIGCIVGVMMILLIGIYFLAGIGDGDTKAEEVRAVDSKILPVDEPEKAPLKPVLNVIFSPPIKQIAYNKKPVKQIVIPSDEVDDYLCVTKLPIQTNAVFGSGTFFKSLKIVGASPGYPLKGTTYSFLDESSAKLMTSEVQVTSENPKGSMKKGSGYVASGQIPAKVSGSFNVKMYIASINTVSQIVVKVSGKVFRKPIAAYNGGQLVEFRIDNANAGDKLEVLYIMIRRNQAKNMNALILNGLIIDRIQP